LPRRHARNAAKGARIVHTPLCETRETFAKRPAKLAKRPAKRRVPRVTYRPSIGMRLPASSMVLGASHAEITGERHRSMANELKDHFSAFQCVALRCGSPSFPLQCIVNGHTPPHACAACATRHAHPCTSMLSATGDLSTTPSPRGPLLSRTVPATGRLAGSRIRPRSALDSRRAKWASARRRRTGTAHARCMPGHRVGSLTEVESIPEAHATPNTPHHRMFRGNS
jgi:hypothetical protein